MNKELKEFVELLNSGKNNKETDHRAVSLLENFYEEFTTVSRDNGMVHPDISEIVKMATPEVLTAMFMATCIITLKVCSNES